MDSPSQKGAGKKKINEVKTFPVPFPLEKNQGNLTINSKSPSKPSKEQIISQAIRFHEQGKIIEATKYYQYCLNHDFNDPIVFLNYGTILRSIGKLKKAEIFIRKAINIDPNLQDVHFKLGVVLNELNRPKEAIKYFLYESYTSLDNTKKSFYISNFLSENYQTIFDKEDIKYLLNILIKKDNISHDILFNIFNQLYDLEKILDDKEKKLLLHDQLISKSLERMIFTSQRWENFLRKIREEICSILANGSRVLINSESNFLISLAHQCFINEYVYYCTNKELNYIKIIINKMNKGEKNKDLIFVLACYYPLYKLIELIPCIKSFKSTEIKINNLLKLQIGDRKQEIELSKRLKKLGNINDEISKKVMTQYENRPFPSWRNIFDIDKLKKYADQKINDEINPNIISPNFKSKKLKVLIAGCGTGQQVLLAKEYKNSEITGIELSSSSLSYAQRKFNELGINNIKLIQMDILELSLLKEKFDLIESIGVLHHMKSPEEGLKALLEVLKINGFLKLGLYSKKARGTIQAARDYIESRNIEVNEKNIRKFRMSIFNGDLPEFKSFIQEPLFYTVSGVEDLCFHTQEWQFNLFEIQQMIETNKLDFKGFLLPQSIKSLYAKYFPEDKTQTNLQNWARFEEKHPSTFAGMYNFWVSKTKI